MSGGKRNRRGLPLGIAPRREHAFQVLGDLGSCVRPAQAATKETIVCRVVVSHMSLYCQVDGCSVELFGARSTSDPTGVKLARVRRDPGSLLVGTLRIPAANVFGKGGDIRRVLPSAPFGVALTAAPPCLGVLEALSLGTLECLALHKNSLSLIPLAGPAKADDNGVEFRVFAGAPREGSITSWEEL